MRAIHLLLVGFLMAAGITQAAPLATIMCEDQAHADASLDGIPGSYSFGDFALKGLPSGDYLDLTAPLSATLQKRYGSRASVQNGDGVGTAVTTIKDKNAGLVIDTGKTLSISSPGRANRYIELGEKVPGVKNSGKNGCELVTGATLTLQANLRLYGSTLQSIAGAINLQPLGGLIGELIECRLKSAQGITLGIAGAGFQEIYNVDMVLGNGAFFLGNLVADYCERITIALSGPLNARFIQTAAPMLPRDIVFIGTPTTDVIRYSGPPGGGIVEPTYPVGVPVMSVAPFSDFIEPWRFEPVVADEDTALPVAGCLVEIYRRTGGLMLSAVSDVLGRLTYGSGVTAQCLVARYIPSGLTTWNEAWPLTVVLNSDGALGGSYEVGRTYLIPWAYRTYDGGAGGTQKQLEPLQEILQIGPPAAPAPPPSGIPTEADGVERTYLTMRTET